MEDKLNKDESSMEESLNNDDKSLNSISGEETTENVTLTSLKHKALTYQQKKDDLFKIYAQGLIKNKKKKEVLEAIIKLTNCAPLSAYSYYNKAEKDFYALQKLNQPEIYLKKYMDQLEYLKDETIDGNEKGDKKIYLDSIKLQAELLQLTQNNPLIEINVTSDITNDEFIKSQTVIDEIKEEETIKE